MRWFTDMIGFWLSFFFRKPSGGPAPVSDAVNTVAPSITGTGYAGDEHEADEGTWTDALDYQYRWWFNGNIVGSGTEYTPATEGELKLQVRGQDANGVWSAWVWSDPVEIEEPIVEGEVTHLGDPVTHLSDPVTVGA